MPRLRTGIYFGFDFRNRARIATARSLFIRGYPDQASRIARETVAHATTLGNPVIDHAQRHSLAPGFVAGAGVKGELAIRRDDVDTRIRAVRDAFHTLSTAFLGTIAEGLSTIGQCEDPLATANEAIGMAERQGDMFGMPDLMRVKADILGRCLGWSGTRPDPSGQRR